MEDEDVAKITPTALPAMERDTICFPRLGTRDVLRRGDPGFNDTVARLYHAGESDALEALVQLKTRLTTLSLDEFWTALCEGISQLVGSDMSFVMKRMLVDEQDAAVEMPPFGEPGSCMMAAALHYRTGDGSERHLRDTKFFAYQCPCAYMRHDKVFLIPERFDDFIADNPNTLPWQAEAYIAVPLVANGRCFAHFGVCWSLEKAAQRHLSWAFIELLLHSLEDMVQQRLVRSPDLLGLSPAMPAEGKVIPHEAVTSSQSLRPYAGSLSHELRTPMQGIVGMLDIMYTTVREASKTQKDPQLIDLFTDLKEGIEVVQDSSRRAVEAADNVVHAYDMDMSVPEIPALLQLDERSSMSPFAVSAVDRRPEILVAGHDLPIARPNKRRREEALSRHGSETTSSKYQRLDSASWTGRIPPYSEMRETPLTAKSVTLSGTIGSEVADKSTENSTELVNGFTHQPSRIIAPGLRHTNLREVFRFVIDEGLKVGGRPDQFWATETPCGESVQVRSCGSDGTVKTKLIDWSVDRNVPTSLFIDEKDLTKLISCVFRNAHKFTDQERGRISIYARMSSQSRYISITIRDNGPGIPTAFLPKLFRAFSRDDQSITRQSEGLGLGLMVAKGIARKLGGDLVCSNSETSGPNRGSDFEIKLPVKAGEIITRPSSPYSSPRPANCKPADVRGPQTPPLLSIYPPSISDTATADAKDRWMMPSLLPGLLPTTPPSPDSPHRPTALAATTHHSALDLRRIDTGTPPRPRIRKAVSNPEIDSSLATRCPLTFLVAEDNKINRRLLVSMLRKFGYTAIHEAHDGAEAVRQMSLPRPPPEQIDVVLMDLWMPLMDGYEATERILGTGRGKSGSIERSTSPPVSPMTRTTTALAASAAAAATATFTPEGDSASNKSMFEEATEQTSRPRTPTVLAVTADCTDGALERAAQVGMRGFMTKPYKLHDLQRLITEYCASNAVTAQA